MGDGRRLVEEPPLCKAGEGFEFFAQALGERGGGLGGGQGLVAQGWGAVEERLRIGLGQTLPRLSVQATDGAGADVAKRGEPGSRAQVPGAELEAGGMVGVGSHVLQALVVVHQDVLVLQEALAPQVEGTVADAEVTSRRKPHPAGVLLVLVKVVQDDFGLAQDQVEGQLLRSARRDRCPPPAKIAGEVLHRTHHRQPPRGRLPVAQGGKIEQEAVLPPLAVPAFTVIVGACEDAVTEAEQVVPAAFGHTVGSHGEQVRRLGSQDRSQCPGRVLVVVEVTATVAVHTIGRGPWSRCRSSSARSGPGPASGRATDSAWPCCGSRGTVMPYGENQYRGADQPPSGAAPSSPASWSSVSRASGMVVSAPSIPA
jgi:hypothetical protein